MPRVPVRITAVLSAAALCAGLPWLVGSSSISASGASPAGPAIPADHGANERFDAGVMLARPTDGVTFKGRNIKWNASEANDSPACHATRPICVHWTDVAPHSPPAADGDNDNIPNQVEATLMAANESWQVIVNDLGFRAPLPDTRSGEDGGDNRFDIYLADIGAQDLSGYTSSDDRRLTPNSDYRYKDVSAFVVVDNDFRDGQFTTNATPLDRMRVTVAHELFHASQFAYDHAEDKWLAEGTATWIEDQVFDSVNLNRAWLDEGPLERNYDPLDLGRSGNEYGSWVFFQYMAERFGPRFIQQIWRFADDSPQEVSNERIKTYSMRAIARALKRKDRELSSFIASFARDNLRPGRTYNEGDNYPRPDVVPFMLDRRADDTHWLGISMRHLSTTYVAFRPSPDAPRIGSLRVLADGPDRRFHPRYWVTVRFASGKHVDYQIHLGKNGDGSVKVPFGRKRVDSVDISMINASSRMANCFQRDSAFSCGGRPIDENRNYQIRARLA